MILGQVKNRIKSKIKPGSLTHSVLGRIYKMKYLLSCLYTYIRAQSSIVKLLGPQFPRSRKLIVIDITYRCNLGCPNCNRSCGERQAPSNEDMTVEQIHKFIQEQIENEKKWIRIRLAGGEPTLHPHFMEILTSLLEYKRDHSPETCIEIVTNGSGDKVNDVLSKVPKDIVITNSQKGSKHQLFYPFNKAPRDSVWYKGVDYFNGCFTTTFCGTGLTAGGYYPCVVAGGIDRVFGFDKGRKELPSDKDSMAEELRIFCSLCGAFKGCYTFSTYEPVMSPVWRKAYKEYKRGLLSQY